MAGDNSGEIGTLTIIKMACKLLNPFATLATGSKFLIKRKFKFSLDA